MKDIYDFFSKDTSGIIPMEIIKKMKTHDIFNYLSTNSDEIGKCILSSRKYEVLKIFSDYMLFKKDLFFRFKIEMIQPLILFFISTFFTVSVSYIYKRNFYFLSILNLCINIFITYVFFYLIKLRYRDIINLKIYKLFLGNYISYDELLGYISSNNKFKNINELSIFVTGEDFVSLDVLESRLMNKQENFMSYMKEKIEMYKLIILLITTFSAFSIIFICIRNTYWGLK
jgi:hypothetical protein